MQDGDEANDRDIKEGGFMTARDVLLENEDNEGQHANGSSSSQITIPTKAASANRRVKTYRLEAEQWVDLGTGWCLIEPDSPSLTQKRRSGPSASFTCTDDPSGSGAEIGPWIVVVPEDSPLSPLNAKKAAELTDGKIGNEGNDNSLDAHNGEGPKPKKRKIDPKEAQEDEKDSREIWRTSMRTVVIIAAADSDRGGFQRQQDTLIVWTEADGTDMALSFANVTGCTEVWDFIQQVRNHLLDSIVNSVDASRSASHMDEDEDELFAIALSDDLDADIGPNPPSSPLVRSSAHHATNLFKSSTNAGLGVASGSTNHSASINGGLLPKPTLSNLENVETALKYTSRTPSGRERLASWVVKTNYLEALSEVASEAEDLESLDALHTLCVVVQGILLLNDNTIFEYILSDDLFLKVVGILEYDPDFHGMKANYRAHLSDPSRYREVIPIKDANTLLKIHQTYRLQYLKDVILARIIDDPTFSMLNSFIFFHQVDIVQHLQHNQTFLTDLFAIFEPQSSEAEGKAADAMIGPTMPSDSPQHDTRSPDMPSGNTSGSTAVERKEKQHGAILLLQQFCSFAKNLQLSARNTFYRQMGERGLLRVLEQALAATSADGDPSKQMLEDEEQAIRIATIDILMMVIDHNANGVRAHCLKQETDKKQSLVIFLIRLLSREKDLGIQAQMAEALKVLVQTGPETPGVTEAMRARHEDPEAEKFLQYFYDHCMTLLFQPIAELEDPKEKPDGRIALSSAQQALCGHLCDLLSYFVTAHSFRSKYFILSSDICAQVGRLFKTTQKHMMLAALRFFKATIARKDEFYNRFLIKNDLFLPVLEAARDETGKDNLLSSACLDFFEHIRTNNTKAILNHIMDKHGELVRSLTSDNQTLALLVMRWEQNNEPPPEPVSTNETLQRQSMERSTRTLDMEEESYFDDSSDEEVTLPLANKRQQPETSSARKRAKVDKTAESKDASVNAKGMVRSPAQVFQEMAVRGAQGKARGQAKKPAVVVGTAKLVDYEGDDDEDEDDKIELVASRESKLPKTPTRPAQNLPPDRDKLGPGAPALDSVLGSPYHSVSKQEADEGDLPSPPPSLKAVGEKRRREEEEEDMLLGSNKRAKTMTKTTSSLGTKRSSSIANGIASKLKVNLGSILGGKSEKT